jgi:hypothetical protein
MKAISLKICMILFGNKIYYQLGAKLPLSHLRAGHSAGIGTAMFLFNRLL